MTDTRTPGQIERLASIAIARARAEVGSAPAADYRVAVWGLTSIYDDIRSVGGQVHVLANEQLPDGTAEQRLARAQELWQQLLPELERYADRCRQRRYAGTKSESDTIRYAD